MKVIVAGSRELESLWLPSDGSTVVERAIGGSDAVDLDEVSRVISGTARGPDTWGERFAQSRDDVELTRMPADWDKHGKKAGPIRNEQMAKEGDVLVAFWDGQSTGTLNMINVAMDEDIDVTLIRMHRDDVKSAILGNPA